MTGAFVRWVGLRWLNGKVRSGLDGVFVDGLDHLLDASGRGPVVVAATHRSWWDGLLAVWICHTHGLRPTIVMNERNLVHYRFFEAFGAHGIDGLKGVRSALRRLEKPGDILWIFPQGEYTHHLDDLKRGAVWLARKADCPVLPLGVDYPLREGEDVQACLAFGPPVDDLESLRLALAERVEHAGHAQRPLLPATVVAPDRASRMLSWIWGLGW